MGDAKKIISNITENVCELVRDSAKQIAETVDPVKMMEQAVGIKRNDPPAGGEFSKYLKGLGGNITEEEMEKRKKDFETQKEKEMEEAKKIISGALPAHLRPTGPREPSIFEKNKQEEEMKKAQMVEAQKKQPKSIAAPVQKVTGVAARKKKTNTTNFEAQKNIKIG